MDRCERVEPLLSAWLDRELGLGERHRVAAHLARCPSCRTDLDGLRQLKALVRAAPVRRLPTGVRDAATRQTPRTQARTPVGAASRSGAPHPLTVLAAAVGILAGLVTGAAFALGDDPPADERLVRVPVEMFVTDHLVHSLNEPVPAPVLVGAGR